MTDYGYANEGILAHLPRLDDLPPGGFLIPEDPGLVRSSDDSHPDFVFTGLEPDLEREGGIDSEYVFALDKAILRLLALNSIQEDYIADLPRKYFSEAVRSARNVLGVRAFDVPGLRSAENAMSSRLEDVVLGVTGFSCNSSHERRMLQRCFELAEAEYYSEKAQVQDVLFCIEDAYEAFLKRALELTHLNSLTKVDYDLDSLLVVIPRPDLVYVYDSSSRDYPSSLRESEYEPCFFTEAGIDELRREGFRQGIVNVYVVENPVEAVSPEDLLQQALEKHRDRFWEAEATDERGMAGLIEENPFLYFIESSK
ncbi:hypothetical protein GF386_02870 [Candidatus Pacearchaeota archaeon]|nr:hypothetical protein [Candidatus Pacearchaeota archaeon]MBD3283091.1 hypothetical protein [Candidatus Pacearchaeota archaeon]